MRQVLVVPFAILIASWSLFPIYWFVNLSFQPRIDIYTFPAYLFPRNPTPINYLAALGLVKGLEGGLGQFALQHVPAFLAGLKNSLIIATSVMALTLIICLPAGYVFARIDFKYKALIFFLILLGRSVPPISVSIPYYQFYKTVNLLGTFPGMILIHLTLTIPLSVWVLSGFLGSLPAELDKQARIDGCTRFQMFRRVLIPVAAPGLAAVAILAWLDSWNEFIFALLLADVKDFEMIAPAIAAPLYGFATEIEVFTAFLAIAVLPSVIAAIFLVRYMTRLRIVDPLTFRIPE